MLTKIIVWYRNLDSVDKVVALWAPSAIFTVPYVAITRQNSNTWIVDSFYVVSIVAILFIGKITNTTKKYHEKKKKNK